jgi:hypothetical protein
MTAADLCSSYKQWEVQRLNVSIIMEEFFQQVIDFISSLFFFVISLSLSLALPINTMIIRIGDYCLLFLFQ